MKLGDLVVVKPDYHKVMERVGVVVHIYEVDPTWVQTSDSCADILCAGDVWTVGIDDLEVISETR